MAKTTTLSLPNRSTVD